MKLRPIAFHAFLFSFASLLVCAFVSPSVYGQVTLTLTSTNLSVIEGNAAPTLDFTWSNNSGSPIEFWTGGINVGYSVTFVTGDSTDQVSPHFGFPFNPGTCTGLLASGSSCSFTASLVQLLDPPSTVEDVDYGVDSVDFFVSYVTCDAVTGGCSSLPSQVDAQFDFTVLDVGASLPTPEPSTLVIFASGLLSLLATACCRKRIV